MTIIALKRLNRITALLMAIVIVICIQYASPQQYPKAPILKFRPDTLFISDLNKLDSIWVLNIGDAVLLIDSIKAANRYSWGAIVVAPEDTFDLYISLYNYDEEIYKHFPIRVPSSDSALFVFYPPDLCPVCKTDMKFAPFEDSLYFFSNDSIHSPSVLFAHGEGFSSVSERRAIFDGTLKLKQNYPNPFNPITTIEFIVMKVGRVRISIYDLKGQEICTLANGIFSPGEHSVMWNGTNQHSQTVTSGLYFCRLTADDVSVSKSLMLLR